MRNPRVETTKKQPEFVIKNIPDDLHKIEIKIQNSTDIRTDEIDNLNNITDRSKEWSGMGGLEGDKIYSVVVTFTDKVGNTNSNSSTPFYSIQN
ncbi:Ig-like domain-containing protein [Candidatus Williamhamiltonella defendens]|uniref:Ig-like domain-containing protein n=1 Tax=Candidatus Williamhamiltonella defendens TaxID=138072 RepID=UPI00387EB23A